MMLESTTAGLRRMAFLRRARRSARGVAALVWVVAALPAQADWSDDFDGGFQALWHFAAIDDGGDPPATGSSTFSVVDAGADDYLLISHSTKAIRDGGGGAADVFAWVDEDFANLTISADVNAGPTYGQQTVLGVIGRGNPSVGSAYIAAVDFAGSQFAITRYDALGGNPTLLVVDDSLAIDRAKTYRIEFFLLGSSLRARLLDPSTHAVLSTLAVSDGSHPSGGAGILVETAYDGNDNPIAPIVGTFDSVEALPEPGLGTLLAGGTILLAALHRAAAPGLLRRSTRHRRRSFETTRT